MAELGRLQKVELRDIWKTEDKDFTPWLAEEENLKLLSEAINIELESAETEKNVGSFRADILCKDTADDSWVLIENQLAKTDHTHLGQIFTYAAGLEAFTIVWIAEKFTDEHRSALSWLNEITNQNFKFFGIEVKLWKIGNSNIAPEFNLIVTPDNWRKNVGKNSSALTETQNLRLRYWQNFNDFIKQKNLAINVRSPASTIWYVFGIGISNAHLGAIMSTQYNRITMELCLTGNKKQYFYELQKQKDEIEKEVGCELEWRELPDNNKSSVWIHQDADVKDESDWHNQYQWLVDMKIKFENTFKQRIYDLSKAEKNK